jgi:hypothetical protein
MDKRKITIIILIAIILSAAFLLFEISKSPLLNSIAVYAGLLFLIGGSYFLFRDNKIFLFTVLGFIFILGRYLTFYLFLKPYPKISFFVIQLFVFLGIISFGIAIFIMFKELQKK